MRSILTLTLVVLVLACCLRSAGVEAGPSPGRKSSSSQKSNSGGLFSSSNSGGSSKKINGAYGGIGKKKGGSMNMLKKAAVIGAVAYGGYQLGKLTGRFGGYNFGGGYGGGWGFNDWNRWREIDGFMCRDSNDCNWIDRNLYCQDYELDFQPSALWFGGDVARIVGECACPGGMVWDDRELQCESQFFGSVGIIAILGIAVLLVLCCCVGGAFFILRRFF